MKFNHSNQLRNNSLCTTFKNLKNQYYHCLLETKCLNATLTKLILKQFIISQRIIMKFSFTLSKFTFYFLKLMGFQCTSFESILKQITRYD